MNLDFGALHGFSTTIGVFWNWEACSGYSLHFDGYRRYVLLAGDVHHDLFPDQLWRIKPKRIQSKAINNTYPPRNIVETCKYPMVVHLDSNGHIWFFFESSGLCYFDDFSISLESYLRLLLSPGPTLHIAQASLRDTVSAGRCWIPGHLFL